MVLYRGHGPELFPDRNINSEAHRTLSAHIRRMVWGSVVPEPSDGSGVRGWSSKQQSSLGMEGECPSALRTL